MRVGPAKSLWPLVVMCLLLAALRQVAHNDARKKPASFKNNATLEMVVAACNEPEARFDELRQLTSSTDMRKALRKRNMGAVTMRIYCKCAANVWCDAQLENTGREGHTYLTHIARNYDDLATITIFVNGGPGAGSTATRKRSMLNAVMRAVVSALASQSTPALEYLWADGKIFRHLPSAQSQHAWAATDHSCSSSAARRCASRIRCKTFARRRPLKALCLRGDCECDAPEECRWIGGTKANLAFASHVHKLPKNASNVDAGLLSTPRAHLPPATPPDFVHWACLHFAVDFETFRRCGYRSMATFAVGSARVRMLSHQVYKSAERELASHGITGGLAGHYLERLWRSIFVPDC